MKRNNGWDPRVKVFLIREFTQKGSFASWLAEQREMGGEEKEWIVSDEGHIVPTRCSLLSNINFITHNLGCQNTPDWLTPPYVSSHSCAHNMSWQKLQAFALFAFFPDV